jgi:hypothetical protein
MKSPLATSGEAKRRLNICLVCEHLRPFIKQCSQCGCFVYGKVRLNNAKCPEDKW